MTTIPHLRHAFILSSLVTYLQPLFYSPRQTENTASIERTVTGRPSSTVSRILSVAHISFSDFSLIYDTKYQYFDWKTMRRTSRGSTLSRNIPAITALEIISLQWNLILNSNFITNIFSFNVLDKNTSYF